MAHLLSAMPQSHAMQPPKQTQQAEMAMETPCPGHADMTPGQPAPETQHQCCDGICLCDMGLCHVGKIFIPAFAPQASLIEKTALQPPAAEMPEGQRAMPDLPPPRA